ncbi:cell envelope integrity EipB family protein [Rhodoplanes elegans]|nr:cell envelope integrity EipB family protein [Rhodoplanes elegans]
MDLGPLGQLCTRLLQARRLQFRLTAAVVIAAACTAATPAPSAGAAPGLASHRAVYDLKLVRSQGKRSLQSVRGRILYDFSGNACDGWVLQFRQVSELDNGEGKVAVSDLRASTWEDAAAKSFRFSSQNYVNDRPGDMVDGKAERGDGKVAVALTKPTGTTFDLGVEMVFPTEHMRRVLEAAREGKTLLELPVYDGSENGQKSFNTLTVIGPAIGPENRPEGDATAGQAALDGLKRWPVTISYFDRAAGQGEQVPVYAIGFQLYENGISRALRLDYGDFVVAGDMTQLDIKPDKACP